MAKNNITTTAHITRKEYSFALKDTVLRFTLRQDNTSELTAFKKLLELALVDVSKDLESFKKRK